jgi:hypothetical protein
MSQQNNDKNILVPLSLIQRAVDVITSASGPIGPALLVVGELQKCVSESGTEISPKDGS